VCASGQVSCGGSIGCANLTTDPNNCGQCGTPCGAGTCVSGHCVCTATQIQCPTGCASTSNDPNNCGACGNRCGMGTCVSGQCVCNPGTMYCGMNADCADLSTNPDHCGSCGNQCDPNQTCQNGQCVG
jgi:hypothetical protein